MFHRRRRWEHSLNPRDRAEQRGYDAIGATLKERRLAAGLTQRELETLTGIDQTVISRLENGKQYGLRWSRYAILVAVLDERQGIRLDAQPWWATLGKSPRPNSSPQDEGVTP